MTKADVVIRGCRSLSGCNCDWNTAQTCPMYGKPHDETNVSHGFLRELERRKTTEAGLKLPKVQSFEG